MNIEASLPLTLAHLFLHELAVFGPPLKGLSPSFMEASFQVVCLKLAPSPTSALWSKRNTSNALSSASVQIAAGLAIWTFALVHRLTVIQSDYRWQSSRDQTQLSHMFGGNQHLWKLLLASPASVRALTLPPIIEAITPLWEKNPLNFSVLGTWTSGKWGQNDRTLYSFKICRIPQNLNNAYNYDDVRFLSLSFSYVITTWTHPLSHEALTRPPPHSYLDGCHEAHSI